MTLEEAEAHLTAASYCCACLLWLPTFVLRMCFHTLLSSPFGLFAFSNGKVVLTMACLLSQLENWC
jgi:hypothetical protein